MPQIFSTRWTGSGIEVVVCMAGRMTRKLLYDVAVKGKHLTQYYAGSRCLYGVCLNRIPSDQFSLDLRFSNCESSEQSKKNMRMLAKQGYVRTSTSGTRPRPLCHEVRIARFFLLLATAAAPYWHETNDIPGSRSSVSIECVLLAQDNTVG